MSNGLYLWVKKSVSDADNPFESSRVIGPIDSFAEIEEESNRVSKEYNEQLVAVYDSAALKSATYQLAYPEGFDKIAGVDAMVNNNGVEYDKDPYFKGYRDGYNAAKELTNE